MKDQSRTPEVKRSWKLSRCWIWKEFSTETSCDKSSLSKRHHNNFVPFQMKKVNVPITRSRRFPIFVLAGSSIPAMRQIELPLGKKRVELKRGKLGGEGKILNNLMWRLFVSRLTRFKTIKKTFLSFFVLPQNGATFHIHRGIFPHPQYWYPSTKKTHSCHQKTKSLTGKKGHLIFLSKLAIFNVPIASTKLSWKCKFDLQTAKVHLWSQPKSEKREQGTILWGRKTIQNLGRENSHHS